MSKLVTYYSHTYYHICSSTNTVTIAAHYILQCSLSDVLCICSCVSSSRDCTLIMWNWTVHCCTVITDRWCWTVRRWRLLIGRCTITWFCSTQSPGWTKSTCLWRTVAAFTMRSLTALGSANNTKVVSLISAELWLERCCYVLETKTLCHSLEYLGWVCWPPRPLGPLSLAICLWYDQMPGVGCLVTCAGSVLSTDHTHRLTQIKTSREQSAAV